MTALDLEFVRKARRKVAASGPVRSLDKMTMLQLAKRTVIFTVDAAGIASLMDAARQDIPGLTSNEIVQAVVNHNPDVFWAIARKDHFDIASPRGRRTVAAKDFFLGALTVDLAADEMLTRIVFPKLRPSTGWGFAEVARRSGDFALAAVAATLTVAEGVIKEARIAMTGVDETAKRASEAEAMLAGQVLTPGLIDDAIAAVRAGVTPATDLHASSDYRRHLVGVLAGRALAAAWARARGEDP